MRLSGLKTQSRLAPGSNRTRTSHRGLALTAAVGVIIGVHDRTSYSRSEALVPGATCLAQVNVLVIDVADLTHSSHAVNSNTPHLTGRKTYQCIVILLAHELCHVARSSYKLCALAGVKLQIVDKSTHGDISQCQSIAGLDVSVSACPYHVPYLRLLLPPPL